jgi:hypothetical protein
MNNLQKYFSASLLATAALLAGASPAWAQVSLGSASGFAVLGGTNVTCTDGSVVTGDVGVSPGSAVPFTNTGCEIAGATPPATNAAAARARTAFLNAYIAVQRMACTSIPGNLAGMELRPGVCCLDAVAKSGTLTLAGNANGVWIFRVDGALTGTNFSVAMSGGGRPCNVFWAPTGAATMTDSAFKGNILAGDATIGSITLTGGNLAGRALANVAVTMTGASVIGCDALCKGKDCKQDCDKHCKQDCGKHSDDCESDDSGHHGGSGGKDDDCKDRRGGKK